MRPYTCDKCGHRNYVTAAGLEGERADTAMRRLEELGKPKRSFASTFSAVIVVRRLLNLK